MSKHVTVSDMAGNTWLYEVEPLPRAGWKVTSVSERRLPLWSRTVQPSEVSGLVTPRNIAIAGMHAYNAEVEKRN